MIKIIADSTCDLNSEIETRYDIEIVPLTIEINGKILKDREEITATDYYRMLEEKDEFTNTAAPSPGAFRDAFIKAVQEGHREIICICMSSGTSGSYHAAEVGKDLFMDDELSGDVRLHIVDSKSMSHGSGWMVLYSAKMREKGASFDEIVDFNEIYKTKIKHLLSMDDLAHLVKSGRISGSAALVGKIMNVMPVMSMRDGKGAVFNKVRGRKRLYGHYIEEFRKRADEKMNDFVIIGYSSEISYAETFKKLFQEATDFIGDIYIMQMGAVVGTHVGLRGLSFFFCEK